MTKLVFERLYFENVVDYLWKFIINYVALIDLISTIEH
jgi:hypothetical protein